MPSGGSGVWSGNRRRLLSAAEEEGLDSLVLISKGSQIYATGLRDPSGAVILSRDCGLVILVPLLDYHRMLASAPGDARVVAFYRGSEESIEADIPKRDLVRGGLVDALKSVLGNCGGKAGGELSTAPYGLARKLEELGVRDAGGIISRVRSVKSRDEIALIEHAARIAEDSFARLLSLLDEGISEAEAAAELYKSMVAGGAWGEAFPTIVAFYDNTAYPHHTPGGLRLGVEGPVLVDWGAVYSGYRSDTTRTFWWGAGSSEAFTRHLEDVVEAVNKAYDVLGPGVKAWEVDNAARVYLRKRGLARYFIHGLGHGVGVDIHEEPYLRPGSETELEPGMVVTVEPGVYMPGLYGIRVEDLVVVTPSGFRVITRLPHIIPF